MRYLIVENSVIINIVEADPDFAVSIGAKEDYTGATIGQAYDPPTPAKLQAHLTEANVALAELAEAEAAHDLENKLALAELAEMMGGTSNG